jgi:hypothetical protein
VVLKSDRQGSSAGSAAATCARYWLPLQNPDSTAASGRNEVYRALAARIKESKTKDIKELVEEVLPKIEQLFETPEQKRVRDVRAGITFTCAGLGLALYFLLRHFVNLASFAGSYGTPFENILLAGALVALVGGLGYVFSAWLFPATAGRAPGLSDGRDTNELWGLLAGQQSVSESTAPPSSITENTTRELEGRRAAPGANSPMN